eukprot:5732798-Amphidinium_carterae.1
MDGLDRDVGVAGQSQPIHGHKYAHWPCNENLAAIFAGFQSSSNDDLGLASAGTACDVQDSIGRIHLGCIADCAAVLDGFENFKLLLGPYAMGFCEDALRCPQCWIV